MRRSISVLSSSLAAIGLTASVALAQQFTPSPAPSASSPAADDSAEPSMASRPTRYLLRNGMDYLAYREYARALTFFRAAEARQGDLSPSELASLKKGIAKAQQGTREAVNGTKVVVQAKGRPSVQPGAFALAKSAPTDPIQLASAELPMPSPPPLSGLPPLPASAPAPTDLASQSPVPAEAPLSLEPPVARPESASKVDPRTQQAQAPVELPPAAQSPSPLPTEPQAPPPLVLESPGPASTPVELPPSLPSTEVELPPTVSPPLPMPAEPTPTPDAPVAEPARVAVAPQRTEPAAPAPRRAPAPVPVPVPVPEPLPAPEVAPAAEVPTASRSELPLTMPDTILSPRLAREVEQIAQRPLNTGEDRAPGAMPPGTDVTDPNAPPTNPGSPRLELPRAPSPTEARPLRRIPVPEEFVPLGKREWDPNRKYWAAAGTCHMILYFQDPVLERYGQGVEQSLGPIGRYFSYPLDDPKQSNQRNQLLQPFYSAGKFAFQVGTLPYKLLIDPPWEAEYDLGYYRPGDRIPADTIMITPTGVGPPLKGRNY